VPSAEPTTVGCKFDAADCAHNQTERATEATSLQGAAGAGRVGVAADLEEEQQEEQQQDKLGLVNFLRERTLGFFQRLFDK